MTEQSFFDERINGECGKIYHRGILYAMLLALCYGVFHFIHLDAIIGVSGKAPTLSNFYIFLLPEAAVFFGGCIILLLGQIFHGKTEDERSIFERHRYYLSAAKVFVFLAFFAYEITVPFAAHQWANDVPLNYLVKFFETLGVIYLYYAFKKRNIFFNYSFIHERKGIYYKRVFLNIAKFASVLLIGFFLSAFLDVLFNSSLSNLWALLIAYALSVLSLGLEYLFISWTEKLSYDEKEHRGLHIGTFIKFIFLLINISIAFFVMLLLLQISHGFWAELFTESGYHLSEIIAELTNIRNHFSHESSVLTTMVLCKFMCQIRDCKMGRKAITGIVLLTAVSLLINYVSPFITYDLASKSYEAISTYISISHIINLVISTINALLWTWLIHALVTFEKLPSLLWAVVGVRWYTTVFGAVAAFLGHQGLSVFYSISGGILGFAALLLLLILLHRHQFSHEHEEYV